MLHVPFPSCYEFSWLDNLFLFIIYYYNFNQLLSANIEIKSTHLNMEHNIQQKIMDPVV